MSGMFSNWISKGAEVITNSAKSLSTNQTPQDYSQIVKELLNKIQIRLSNELGENMEKKLDFLAEDLINQQQLQKRIVETKQKYHQLVTQSQMQQETIKEMIQQFINLLRNIGGHLNNQDMSTPLKDIESAFFACNTAKVEKQLKYFEKLYQAALADTLKISANSKTDEFQDEISLFKNLNKNLQVELFRSRNNCQDLEKRVNELHCSNQEMSERLSILQKLGAESAVLASAKEKQKFQARENELLDRIKSLQRQKNRVEKISREAEKDVVKSGAAIQIIKSNQENIIEEIRRDFMKKQANYQASMSKILTEKITMEDKLRLLTSENESLRSQVGEMKSKQLNSPKKQSKGNEVKELIQKIKDLQEQLQQKNVSIQSMVNRQVMKVLFLGFDDQSKEWTVKRDIRNQIYLLLEIKPKKQVKVEEKKWFGMF